MAGDWIKMRAGLGDSAAVYRLATAMGVSHDQMVAALHKLAAWFHGHGKHGKLKIDRGLIDRYMGLEGFASALAREGWLRDHDGVLCVRGFCDVSAARKSLGRKVRRQVLDGATCNACGRIEGLVIDHIVPVVRGGSCELSNLQALCRSCNARKGRKTMDEFMAEVSP